MKFSLPELPYKLSPDERYTERGDQEPAAQATLLELASVCVALEGTPIVCDVSLQIEEGQIGCLVGPSGCGKTTLLRCIAGFEPTADGTITIKQQTVSSVSSCSSPESRGVGMVFQDLALFPHMTVAENIGFGMSGFSRKEIAARVSELLELVGLEDYAKSYPHQLSGGQQQRIALIRAMAPRPDLLLLDEPFSSQDTELRVKLAHEVRDLLKRDGITAILVTHDQHEAFAIADKIGVMSDGQLLQWDSAWDLYHRPSERFVADFIGEGVFICGNTMQADLIQTELGIISGALSEKFEAGTQIDLLVRPDDIVHDEASPNKGTVVAKDFRGADHLYTLRMPGSTRVLCLVPSHFNHEVGESIGVKLRLDHLVIFERDGFADEA